MTVTPQNHPRLLPVIGTAVAIVVGVLLVNRLSATSSEARPQLAAAQATVGLATDKVALPAPRVRYQATIDNWRRFRDLNNPN
jgi:hypothetical protein